MISRECLLGPRARLVWRVALLLALLALALLAADGVLGALQGGALVMLPAIALAVVMLTHPYLGEEAIARLRERRGPRERTAALAAPALRAPERVARGGRLIAVALAGRAPPPPLAACR